MSLIKKIIFKIPLLINSFIFIKYIFNRFLINGLFKNEYINNLISIEPIIIQQNSNSFFGYYNITPFNDKGDVLVCNVHTNKVRGSLIDDLSINIKSKDRSINKVASSKAWNWQQSCMLQWFASTNEFIIYNDYSTKENKYLAKIQNIYSGDVTIINYPIYSVAKSGKFALTLNFDRLSLMRPDYGYFNKNISLKDLPSDSEDGIWFLDIEANKAKILLSLEQLKKFKPNASMNDAKHKVNHIDIAPNGKRFMFLHRWIGPQGRFMRLLSANCIDGSDLFYLTGDKMVSHNCWWGNNDIISFCQLPDGRNRYAHLKDKVGIVGIIGENDFFRDGHPSVSPDGRWMLTDDYPDKNRFSNLYLYDLIDKKKITLGSFFQPLSYKKEKRIDLHPKWSLDGNHISIDSGHKGKRSMYIINIENIVKINK